MQRFLARSSFSVPCWRQTQEQIPEPVGTREQETRKSKAKSKGDVERKCQITLMFSLAKSTDWRQSVLSIRQRLFEEYLGEDMVPRGFSHCIKVMARSLTFRHGMVDADGRWSS